MKTHYKNGERIKVTFRDGTHYKGTVEGQRGTMLKVKWDHVVYRPEDRPFEIDYRDVEIAEE